MNTALAGVRVLVVEDEYFLADDMAQALQRAGAEIAGPVGNLAEAMAWLASEHADAVVLDLNLAGRSGIEIADALKERGVPFVFATGYDAAAIPERHRDVPLWEKPFDVDALARAIARRGASRAAAPAA